MNTLTPYLIRGGLIGCILFFTLVIIFFRTGLVYTARKSDGTLKEDIPPSGKLAMLILPIAYFMYQVLSNYIGLVQQDILLNFTQLYWLNFGIYLILFLFDTFFIDGFVLAIWRPAFLHIPDEMGETSMKKHILISIPIGILIGGILTIFSSTASYLLWMR